MTTRNKNARTQREGRECSPSRDKVVWWRGCGVRGVLV